MNTDNRKPALWREDLENKLDYERTGWRKHIVTVSNFVNDNDLTIMDLGAGNMHLRKLLSKEITYYPVDYKKYAEDTIVCDFNKGEFPELNVDVICAVGILEYINNSEWFLEQIISHCRKCIITYKGREKYNYSMLYTEEIVNYMTENGFAITGRCDDLDEWTLIACFEKMSAHNLRVQSNCTGCGCCANVCTVNAISMEYDEHGFLKPLVDETKCVNCGKCVQVCPSLNKRVNNENENPKCYAAWASDDIRIQSSSGGFFTVLAEEIIKKNGYVFGAIWDDDFFCMHVGTNDRNMLGKMRYSKYVQSNTKNTYREVKQLLLQHKLVGYFGTPCQIAGLNSYLDDENVDDTLKDTYLISVDLVCLCAPSNQLFRKYLDEEYGIHNVKDVNFGNKTMTKWSPYGYKIEFINGDVFYPTYQDDMYQKAFHSILLRNNVCENCIYTDLPRQGDFTIGDFWGIDRKEASWNDKKGTSIILANNSKAENFLESIAGCFQRIEEVPLELVTRGGNRIGKGKRKGHVGRHYFEKLVKIRSFNDAVEQALANYHDIGLVCVFNRNIGNNLTNYALYRVISDMGYAVLVIGNVISKNTALIEDVRFERFLQIPYERDDILKLCDDKAEFIKCNDMCGMFCVGSDQIWRNNFVVGSDFYTCLDWVKSHKNMISYGTSFGTDIFEGDNRTSEKMSYLLRRFQKISVREESGANILKNHFGCEADVVLDPVFLCDKKYYYEMAQRGAVRGIEGQYIGAYVLDISSAKEQAILSLSEKYTDNKYQVITDFREPLQECFTIDWLKSPSVEEWLYLIQNSEFFITDSFHGVCFAIIFEKAFAVIFDSKNWRGYTRLEHVLKKFHLEERLLDAFDEDKLNSLYETPINYHMIRTVLGKEKECCLNWLSKAIQMDNAINADYCQWDDVLDLQFKNYMKMRELEIETKKNIELNHSNLRKHIKDNVRKVRSELFLAEHKEICGMGSMEGDSMQVVAFGAGDCFRRNITKIKEVYDIKYVCDNNPMKWNQELEEGVVCISPQLLAQMQDVLVVIMVDSITVAFDIVRDLQKLGISNYTHVTNWMKYINV